LITYTFHLNVTLAKIPIYEFHETTKHGTVHLSQGLTIYIPDKGIRYNQLECLRYGTNINEFLDINGSL